MAASFRPAPVPFLRSWSAVYTVIPAFNRIVEARWEASGAREDGARERVSSR
jgi:hypothetical protein